MDAFGRVIAVILAAILIFLFPLQYLAINQEVIIDNHVHSETTEFTDEIMMQGYLTIEMYNNYIDSLDVTHQLYDIELIHSKPMEGYDMGSIGTTKFDKKLSQSSENYNHEYDVAGNYITLVEDTPLQGFSTLALLNRKENLITTDNSIINNKLSLMSTHIHTAACYAGHNHTASNCSYYSGHSHSSSCYHSHSSSCYHTHSSVWGSCYTSQVCGGSAVYSHTSSAGWGSTVCPTCGVSVDDGYSLYYVCSICGASMGTISVNIDTYHHGNKLSGGGGATNDNRRSSCTNTKKVLTCNVSTSSPICGISTSTAICGYYSGQGAGYTCGYSNDSNPRCGTVVTSISPTNPTQTVIKGAGIVITATATYLNGTTGTVSCTSNYNGNVGTQTVTLTYTGLVDNAKTSGSKTCTISVTTKPNIVSCTAGLGHPDYSGELEQCPICSAISGISFTNTSLPYTGSQQGLNVISTTGTTAVVYYNNSITKPDAVGNYTAKVYVKINGTEWFAKATTFTIYRVLNNLIANMATTTIYKGDAFPIVSLQLNYNNGTNETITSGWTLAGFNTNTIGTQNVTISYGGVNTVASILVKPNPSGFTVTPSKTIIYKGDSAPTFTCRVNYENNTNAVVTATVVTAFNPELIGMQTIEYSYTENGKTLYATCTVTVKPNVVSLAVIPSSSTVYNGSEPNYSVRVNYEDDTSSNIITGYTKTGYTKGAGTKTVTFFYTENEKTVSTSLTIIVQRNTNTCINGHTYELDDYDTDHGCPECKITLKSIRVAPEYLTVEKGSNLEIKVTALYFDGHTEIITSGWSSNLNNSQIGNQLVTVTYGGKSAAVNVTVVEYVTCPICGTVYQPSIEKTGCPICSQNVVNISASPSTQVISIGENITFEVTATYSDGHSEIVYDWTSNFNTAKVGEQTVTIFYANVTTQVTVIVESDKKVTCSICGSVYDITEYPEGCPFCSKTIGRIEASLRSGGTTVPYGSELNLSVILIYRDGHRETAYNDWSVEGYDAQVLGNQILTVTYKGHQISLTVEVVNSLIKTVCINGHVYYLNADGSDPGCPYCNLDGNIEFSQGYIDCIYTDTILEELYANGIYYFDKGDYITVTIIPRSISFIKKMQSLFKQSAVIKREYSYGGEIRGKFF